MKYLGLLLIAISTTASAADWKLAAQGSNVNIFIDSSSVAAIGKYRKAWAMYSYSEGQTLDDYAKTPYLSAKQLAYYDCGAKQSTGIQFIYYDGEAGSGASKKSTSYKFNANDLTDVVPDSVGEGLLTYVCSRKLKTRQ